MLKSFLLVNILMFTQITNALSILPKTVKQLKDTSVRILNTDKDSGGSGSIYQSTPKGSFILTNKHVCKVIENGGVIMTTDNEYPITHYKQFNDHDLCLIRVDANLGISLRIATDLAKDSDLSVVSGHPNLLPHITSVGHISERMEIELITGIKPCTDEDMKTDPMSCIFLGGMPEFKILDSQLISNLVMPGSSGSAVFNKKGEIVGVVFAGSGRGFSYGWIVPQLYVLYFLHNSASFKWVKAEKKEKTSEAKTKSFEFERCTEILTTNVFNKQLDKLKRLCKTINDPLIWSK